MESLTVSEPTESVATPSLHDALIRVCGNGHLLVEAARDLRDKWATCPTAPEEHLLPTSSARAQRAEYERRVTENEPGLTVCWGGWPTLLEDAASAFGDFLVAVDAALELVPTVAAAMDDQTRPVPERWTTRCRAALREARWYYNEHKYGVPSYGCPGFWRAAPEDPEGLEEILKRVGTLQLNLWEAGMNQPTRSPAVVVVAAADLLLEAWQKSVVCKLCRKNLASLGSGPQNVEVWTQTNERVKESIGPAVAAIERAKAAISSVDPTWIAVTGERPREILAKVKPDLMDLWSIVQTGMAEDARFEDILTGLRNAQLKLRTLDIAHVSADGSRVAGAAREAATPISSTSGGPPPPSERMAGPPASSGDAGLQGGGGSSNGLADNLSWRTKLYALASEHPGWSLEKLAKEAGVSRGHIYREQEVLKTVKRLRSRPPVVVKGSKDGATGEVEASDD